MPDTYEKRLLIITKFKFPFAPLIKLKGLGSFVFLLVGLRGRFLQDFLQVDLNWEKLLFPEHVGEALHLRALVHTRVEGLCVPVEILGHGVESVVSHDELVLGLGERVLEVLEPDVDFEELLFEGLQMSFEGNLFFLARDLLLRSLFLIFIQLATAPYHYLLLQHIVEVLVHLVLQILLELVAVMLVRLQFLHYVWVHLLVLEDIEVLELLLGLFELNVSLYGAFVELFGDLGKLDQTLQKVVPPENQNFGLLDGLCSELSEAGLEYLDFPEVGPRDVVRVDQVLFRAECDSSENYEVNGLGVLAALIDEFPALVESELQKGTDEREVIGVFLDEQAVEVHQLNVHVFGHFDGEFVWNFLEESDAVLVLLEAGKLLHVLQVDRDLFQDLLVDGVFLGQTVQEGKGLRNQGLLLVHVLQDVCEGSNRERKKANSNCDPDYIVNDFHLGHWHHVPETHCTNGADGPIKRDEVDVDDVSLGGVDVRYPAFGLLELDEVIPIAA